MKLLALLLALVCSSKAFAQTQTTIAEFISYGKPDLPLTDTAFVDELLTGGSDITSTIQQQLQCQQQQHNGYEPEYIQMCDVKVMIYRQKIHYDEKGAFILGKSAKKRFELGQTATQIIQQNQQQIQQQMNAAPSLYLQCKLSLARYYEVLNPRWNQSQGSYVDPIDYHACLENGGDPGTCKIATTHNQQQQQPQQRQTQPSSWRIQHGSCKVVATH